MLHCALRGLNELLHKFQMLRRRHRRPDGWWKDTCEAHRQGLSTLTKANDGNKVPAGRWRVSETFGCRLIRGTIEVQSAISISE